MRIMIMMNVCLCAAVLGSWLERKGMIVQPSYWALYGVLWGFAVMFVILWDRRC